MADIAVSSGRLIAGQKVAGTSVYNTAHEKLGTVEDVMIDKPSGRIAYAVLSFGGFLGIGDRHHPMPWQTMRYDPDLGGYVVDIDRTLLDGAPAYGRDDPTAWDNEGFGSSIDDYYKAVPPWSVLP